MPRTARKKTELTVENVRRILIDCLWTKEEISEIPQEEIFSMSIKAEGVKARYTFNPKKIEEHRRDIREMLECLPESFMKDSEAGGDSFLKACLTKDGTQWGEHRDIDDLMTLGIATKDLQLLITDRNLWSFLPGGLPYFCVRGVNDNE